MTSNLIFFLILAPLRAFTLSNCDELPRLGVLKTEVNGSPVILSTVEKIIGSENTQMKFISIKNY